MPLAAAAADPVAYDLIRVAALVLGSALVAATSVVCAVYNVVWRKHAKLHAQGRVAKWRGMLPRHVVAVSVMAIGLTLSTMYEIAIRLRDDPSGRALFYGALYIIGMTAMWDVLGHARYRLHGMRDPQPTPGEAPNVNPDMGTGTSPDR